MTAPDPQTTLTAREIARKHLTVEGATVTPADIVYAVKAYFGDGLDADTLQSWCLALRDELSCANVTAALSMSWPDEQPANGRPAADLAHAAEDVRKHLALRAHAVNDEVLRSPEVISVARVDGHAHALMESVVRTLLAERDALAAYVEAKLAEPAQQPQDDEAQHARAFLAGLRENITGYHEPLPGEPWRCTCGAMSGCNRGADDLAAIATLEAALNTAAPQYFVDGQPVDRESYEAWADEGRATAGIDFDERDVDDEGGPF